MGGGDNWDSCIVTIVSDKHLMNIELPAYHVFSDICSYMSQFFILIDADVIEII